MWLRQVAWVGWCCMFCTYCACVYRAPCTGTTYGQWYQRHMRRGRAKLPLNFASNASNLSWHCGWMVAASCSSHTPAAGQPWAATHPALRCHVFCCAVLESLMGVLIHPCLLAMAGSVSAVCSLGFFGCEACLLSSNTSLIRSFTTCPPFGAPDTIKLLHACSCT